MFKLVRVTTSRNHFTTHGLHLNYTGKETITKEILNNLPLNCESQSLPAIKLPWKDECGNVNVPITKKESSKVMLDKKADTEEAREITVIAAGNYIESKTGAEAMSNLASNETAQHLDKQEISSKPPETGETSKEISRNPKSQRKLASKFCRKDHLGGGVCIFVKKGILYESITLNHLCKEKSIEICAIKLHFKSFTLIILCIYRAPTGNLDFF